MRKSVFKRLLQSLRSRDKHVSKSRRFNKLVPNSVGSKFRKRCFPTAGRRADGTLRTNFTAQLRSL